MTPNPISARDYGVTGGCLTLDTRAIQAASAACVNDLCRAGQVYALAEGASVEAIIKA